MAVSWENIGLSVAVNGGACVVVFFVFNFLRRLAFVKDFFAPKRRLSIPFRFRPPRLPATLFTWMLPVFKLSEEHNAAIAGVDALIYMRFLSLAMRMCVAIFLVTWIMVLPTNWTGSFVQQQLDEQAERSINANACDSPDGGDDPLEAEVAMQAVAKNETNACAGIEYVFTTFDKTSLSNIPQGSDRMWVHVVAVWLVAGIVMKMLWDAFDTTVKWRVLHLSRMRKGDEAHTVLVQDIPGVPYGTIVGRIYDNIDGTIGRLLPKAFKAKVQEAMDKGLGAVFGVADQALSSDIDLFKDSTYDVYLKDTATATTPPPEAPIGFSTYDSVDDTLFSDAHSQREGDLDAAVAAAALGQAPTHISGRRNLRFYESRRPGTDFEVWAQAEAAINEGLDLKELVHREFSRTMGAAHIECVTVVKNEQTLGAIVRRYEAAKLKLEDLCDKWMQTLRRKLEVKRRLIKINPGKLGPAAEARWSSKKAIKVDEMEFMIWNLQDLKRQIQDEQAEAQNKEACAAFVTFKKRLHQSMCATGLQSREESLWKTSVAPSPEEILWHNVSWRGWERGLRKLLGWGIFITMILFFMPVIAVVQSIINLEKYRDDSEIVDWLLSAPFLGNVVQSILPTLALKIFLIIVPMLLRLMNNLQGVYSKSSMDFEVARKYYLFQFVVVFVASTLIGVATGGAGNNDNPFLSIVEDIIDDPNQIFELLGTAVPKQASFFILYTLTNGLLAKAIQFLRIPGAVIYMLLSRLAGTERAKKRCWSNQYMRYGDEVPDHSITVLLLLVFCVIQPFMVPVAFAYFGVNLFFAKYNMLYVKREEFQTGGLLWPVIFDQFWMSLTVFVVTMFGLLSVKGFAGSPTLIPLIVICFLFRSAAHTSFTRPLETISLHAASDLDRADEVYDWMRELTAAEEKKMREKGWDLDDIVLGPVHERYIQSVFKVSEEQYKEALQEAQYLLERVNQHERLKAEGGDRYKDVPLLLDENGEPQSVESDTDAETSDDTGPASSNSNDLSLPLPARRSHTGDNKV